MHLVKILSFREILISTWPMRYEILLSIIMSCALYELHLDLIFQRSGMLLLFVNSDNGCKEYISEGLGDLLVRETT